MINLRVMMASQNSFMKPFGKKLKLLCPIQRKSFLTEELSTSQKQAVVKLIEKRQG